MSAAWIVNPRRKRKKATSRKRRSASRRTNPTHRRRRRATRAVARPHRVRRRARRAAVRTNPRRMHRRRIRRNPRGLGGMMSGAKGFVGHTLLPGLVGAGGAIGLDVLLGFVPLPAVAQSGPVNTGVKLAGAVLLGVVASKVMNRRVGASVAMGAATVVLYDALKNVIHTAVPSLPGLSGYSRLEYYAAGQNAGTRSMAGYSVMPRTAGGSMGEYVPG